MNKYILAIDSFKGCLTSAEAENAATTGIKRADKRAEVVSVPVSDGGEGMLDAVLRATNGQVVTCPAHDLLMRQITVEYGIINHETAVIETAKVIGMALLGGKANNIMSATSYGVGEVIMNAISKGCSNFIIGLGGSATSDCGIGMLRALIKVGGKADFDEVSLLLSRFHFTIACDVSAPLYGDNGAAHVFASQKGATTEQVGLLERRAKTFARMSAKHLGHDKSMEMGAGAAGGLGYAFMQFLNAEARPGADLLLGMAHFEELLDGTTRVITGEGCADRQTLMGKLPCQIMRMARLHNVPTWLIAGKVEDREALLAAGFDSVMCVNPPNCDMAEAVITSVATVNIIQTMESTITREGL